MDAPLPASDPCWAPALARVLDTPDAIAIHVQPIVDLVRGTVVGHEALARFTAPPQASPDRWFAAAAHHGQDVALAAATLQRALARLPELPANTFLTVNLEPGHALAPPVQAVLANQGRLERVVVEITEHTAPDDVGALRRQLDVLRELGARTAIDDAGAGHAGLQALLTLRPDLIKLDRSLVQDLDTDPARRVLLRAVGELADGIDAWVLGEGIETDGELAELVGLGVPLGQGYRLGRPQAGFTTDLDPTALAVIVDRRQRRDLELVVASIMTQAHTTRESDTPEGQQGAAATTSPGGLDLPQVVVDAWERPVGLRDAGGRRRGDLLLVKPSEPLTAVARRVTARRAGRFTDPVLVTDGRGRLLGIVEVPRLLEALAAAVG